jgi:hypothetical protein
MKQDCLELAKEILKGKKELEDKLVETIYQLMNELEVTPEEFETARDAKRAKNHILSSIEDVGKKLMKATKKDEIVENLGDVLEIVETYTARY